MFLLAAMARQVFFFPGLIGWFDLSETAFTFARFKYLTRFKLDNTGITGAEIGYLKNLPRFRALNLYGTNVMNKELKILQPCKQLMAKYLDQTQTTPRAMAALQQALGDQVEITFGYTSNNTGNL